MTTKVSTSMMDVGASVKNLLDTPDTSQLRTATVNLNALTLGMGTASLSFRSATLADGNTYTRLATPANLVVPSGATLGTYNNAVARLALLAIDNAGVVELAVVNATGGGFSLNENNLISTTAISGTSNSIDVAYSTTARTNVPFRVVAYIYITEVTAGTWATAPSSIVAVGGSFGSGGSTASISGAIIENSSSIAADYTITTGNNAMSAGPITINTGVTVTVPTGSVWTIV